MGEVDGEGPQEPRVPQSKEDVVDLEQDAKEVKRQQEEKGGESPAEPEEEDPEDIMPSLREGTSGCLFISGGLIGFLFHWLNHSQPQNAITPLNASLMCIVTTSVSRE